MSRQTCVSAVGGGSSGASVASLAARGAPTLLWTRREEVADEIVTDHVNSDSLPGELLDEALMRPPTCSTRSSTPM